jgi:subtilase family serine protease
MSGTNEFGLPNDPQLVFDGSSLPVAFPDPFSSGQEKRALGNNPPTAAIGTPSTDLLTPDTSNPSSVSEELLNAAPANNFLTIKKSDDTSTDTDPLTGSPIDAPLVGFETLDARLKGLIVANSFSVPSFLNLSDPDSAESNINQQQISTSSAPGLTGLNQHSGQLTPSILEIFRFEALARWNSLGITQADQDILNNITLSIADLPGYKLGLTSGYAIRLDSDAAGQGWFIDSPSDDSEFSNIVSNSELQATASDPGFGKVDLLTVITHEFGHILGLDHIDDNQVMSATLPTGTRRLLTREDLNFSRLNEPINEAQELDTQALYRNAVLADSPIGYWSLDEVTGTVATDASGNGNNAFYQNGVTLLSTGSLSKAASFDGIDDILEIPINSPETNYTYELWFKTAVATTGISIVRDDGASQDRLLYLQDGNIYHGLWSYEIIGSSGKNYADDQWHHAAVVVQSGVGQKIFVDGKLVAFGSKDTSDFNWDTRLVAGETVAPYWGIDAHYKGSLDEIALYNSPLSSEQIRSHYQALTGIDTSPKPEPTTISAINGKVEGELDTDDSILPNYSDYLMDEYQLTDFTVGKVIDLNLSSETFDTYLELVNANTNQVINNNNGNGNNSRLIFTAQPNTNYLVRVLNADRGKAGDYTLNATIGTPDLIVSAAIAPTTAPERSIISLTWTVTNQGDVVAGSDWYDYVYLSDNTTFDSSDRYMGYLETSDKTPLEAFSSYTVSKDIALPQQVGATKQYLLFITDYYGNQNGNQIEKSETNNVRAVPIDITVPDLVVTGVTAPIAVTVGSTASVSWTVLNQGSVQATHSWYDRIYISDDQTWDKYDTQVGMFDSGTADTPVVPGDTYTLLNTINIPNTALGNRYLLFVADADNNQYETNENNNIKAIRVEVNAPDLIVESASAPTSAALGEQITVNWQVTNQGSVTASADWYDYIYLSDDQIWDSSDQYITYKGASDNTPLASNTSYSATQNLIIPTYVKAGNRYLLFFADRDRSQGETNENNNVKAVPITLTAPDLVVTNASAGNTSAVPGSTLELSYTVKNQGQISAEQDWYDRIYLSDDAIYDNSDYQLYYFHSTDAETSLAVDGTYTVNNISVKLPDNALGQPGSRYLLFVTDADRNQSETNENNNVTAIPLTITGDNPDLQVITATVPEVVTTQQTVSVSWTVKNTGTLAAENWHGGWYDGVYISSDSTLDANDTSLNSYWVSTPLAVNGEYSLTGNITIPQERTGSQYLLFATDAYYNYQNELNEVNNVRAVSIEVKAPDLQITNVTAPTIAYAGARMEVVWTVSNQGSGSAIAQWYDSVYLSDDDTFSINDDILLQDAAIGNLVPLALNTDYTVMQVLSMPNNVNKGSKYLLFVADRGKNQGELNEGNNVRAVAITIGDRDPNLPLLSTNTPVQNQNTPQGATNTNIATYATLPAVLNVSGSGTGLLGQYYVPGGIVDNFPDFDSIAPLHTRIDQTVDFVSVYDDFGANLGQNDYFAARWTGKINIATPGDVTFYINSDDGARLYIDNQLVVDNGGLHGFQENSASINLTSGQHDLRLEYFEYNWEAGVTLSYTPVGDSKQLIPTSVLTPASLISLPDLQITGIIAPTVLGRGQTINTSWTVANLGSSSTEGAWSDQIYLSDDATLDSSDTRLNSFVAGSSPLFSSSSYTQIQNIVIPTNVGLGNKYLLFVTNPDRPESDRTNNAYALPVTVTSPDLVVTAATVPLTASEGAAITVDWTVKNQGNVPTNVSDWYDSVYLSSNTVFDSSDIYMGSVSINENLEAQQTYSKSESFKLPENSGSGKWYVLVVTDKYPYYWWYNEKLVETSETNNVYAIPIDINIPDLTISNANTPSSVAVGETVSVSWTVKNNGTVSAADSRYDSVYISDDTILDETDTRVDDFYRDATSPLEPNASEHSTKDIIIPQTKLGDRYLLFVVDKTKNQSETNEANNLYATPITITAPDLEVSLATVPYSTALGETISVSWTVTNKGSVVAARDWYDSVYLSDDIIFDGSDQYITNNWNSELTPLAAGASYEIVKDITIPTYVSAGNRYLLFVADRYSNDYNNDQGETNENNNVYAAAIHIKAPDLVVEDTTTPTTATPGSTIELSYTIKNQGEIAATQGMYGRIYLSNDAIYDIYDSELNYQQVNAHIPLGVNETYQVNNISVTLPNSGVGEPGKRYLLFVTHTNDYQRESNESNNVKAVPLEITGENADLEVITATSPSVVAAQETVSVSWTVKNTGALTASADWYDSVYISSDRTFDNNDTKLYYYDELVWLETPLESNGEYTRSRNITIPQDRIGSQYLLFITDISKWQLEFDETNNVYVIPINVEASDLVITDTTTPVKSYPGKQIEVSWTVKNQGQREATQDWYDRIYLSDDAYIDTNKDTLLKEASAGSLSPLLVGAEYSVSQLLTLPSNTPVGSRYLIFVTDATGNQGEINESNNIRAVQILIGDQQPDLTVINATAPESAALGETIAVNWSINNQGNVSASGNWYDSIYISDDLTLDDNDIAVASLEDSTRSSLAVNGIYNASGNITIPNTATGNRYLLFVTDAGFTVQEGNETNNVRAVPNHLDCTGFSGNGS